MKQLPLKIAVLQAVGRKTARACSKTVRVSAQSISFGTSSTVLSFFLGYLGVDRFIRGQILFGILKILDFTGIWTLVDFIIALTKLGNYDKDFVFVDGKWTK